MARGRRSAKREAAETRQAEAVLAAREAETEAARRVEEENQVASRWRTDRTALDRLSTLSRELDRLHREEAKLLRERDLLVTRLRHSGHGWNELSSRTRLSRQALMKRSPPAPQRRRRGTPSGGVDNSTTAYFEGNPSLDRTPTADRAPDAAAQP